MITFQNVTKSFGIGEPALQDVSFTVEPGEFIFLTGHSGAGKTTIARLLMREYLPTAGNILFEDEDISQIPHSKVHLHRRKIGVIYQDYKLLPELTVHENIELALQIIGTKGEEAESRIRDLLELVQLPDKSDLFPSQLSGGEAQRISIARALATAPGVLFADEPTGNLDPLTTDLILQILFKINDLGTTIIMATHDEEAVKKRPTRAFTLSKGRLTVQDNRKKDSKPATKSSDNKPPVSAVNKVEEKAVKKV